MHPLSGFTRRSSPAFSIGGLGWEPHPRWPDGGWVFTPYGGWVCYHCGERFTDSAAAQAHFGSSSDIPPACTQR